MPWWMTLLDLLARICLLLLGVYIVWRTMLSATRTFVLPRSSRDPLSRWVFNRIFRLFQLRARRVRQYSDLDRVMAMFAPTALLSLPILWFALVLFGFALIYFALGEADFGNAIRISGYSLLTLGYRSSDMIGREILEFFEALCGLILIGLLISYLPTMYGAFSRRETQVTLLDTRAGSPPSAVEMLIRVHSIQGLDILQETYKDWETWFAEIEESHTSLAALNFFRSTHPDRSWITASGAILDSAALYLSSVHGKGMPNAALCLRAGYLALRYIADYFMVAYDHDPKPTDPISITREEFNEAFEELLVAGLPMVKDRDQAWRDFSGWRVNYDTALVSLADITMAPYAPWSSDRGALRAVTVKHRKSI